MTVHDRPLTVADIPRLIQIDARFQAATELRVIREGVGLTATWRLHEAVLDTPYDKGRGYAFDYERRAEIAERLDQPETCFLQVAFDAERDGRLVGLADAEYHEWNATVALHTLFIDKDYRGQGVGRRLFEQSVTFARDLNAQALLIETQTNNIPACQFYLHMGCTIVGLHQALYDRRLGETAIFFEYSLSNDQTGSL